MERLRRAGVGTLIDVRNLPRSRWKPWSSQEVLREALEGAGIAYRHLPQMGVVRDQRKKVRATRDYVALWEWYDRQVLPLIYSVLELLENAPHPWSFACMEPDPLKCHRHRITMALEARGWSGKELHP